ncbi:MAG: dihydrodipicolinate synthase family protein [Terriglobia bacterium]
MTHQEIVANLAGAFPPVSTPFNRRGGVDEKGFRANMERYTGIGLGGVVVSGSTGEAPYLTEPERLRLIEIAREVIHPPELVIAGTGLESTEATLRLSREAVARGADALLVLPPVYYKSAMKTEIIENHYRAVADGVKRPVLIYSIPQCSGLQMDVAMIGRLSRRPNIAGLKESSGNVDFVRAILGKVKKGFHLLMGSGGGFVAALDSGAAGGIVAQCGFEPRLCIGLYEAYRLGDRVTAERLQSLLRILVSEITAPYGIPGVKAALDLSGYVGGDPRPPLSPLGAAVRRKIASALKRVRAELNV